MGLVKTLLGKTLLRKKIQVKERVPLNGLTVIHFQMSSVPRFGYRFSTQLFKFIAPLPNASVTQ